MYDIILNESKYQHFIVCYLPRPLAANVCYIQKLCIHLLKIGKQKHCFKINEMIIHSECLYTLNFENVDKSLDRTIM